MVGFSLVHGSGGALLLFPPLLVLWTAIAAVLMTGCEGNFSSESYQG
jgi:hypothetical protein